MQHQARIVAICALLAVTVGCGGERIPGAELRACQDVDLERSGLRIFLLTMPPGDAVWSIFGHNAVWVSDQAGNADTVYNFGYIPTDQSFLLGRFLTGTLDARLSTRTFAAMQDYYGRRGRAVVAQRLDLPRPLAARFANRLRALSTPEKRDYRYHWSKSNCTTWLRDLLDELTDGGLAGQHQASAGVTHRDEVLRHLAPARAVWLGWHFAVGASADRDLSYWETMFLPDRLMQRLALSELAWPDGERQPLVSYTCQIQPGVHGWAQMTPPQRWWELFTAGLCIGLLVVLTGVSWRTRRGSRAVLGSVVILVGLLGGLLGTISVLLWWKSVYVGFWHNENLLQANPGTLLLVWVGVALMRGRPLRGLRYVVALLTMTAVLGGALAWLLGWQQDNVAIVALFIPIHLGICWATLFGWRHPPSASQAPPAPPAQAD